jgi:hypothetical protein
MEYQFKSRKEPFFVKNIDGEVLFQSIIDTGNEELIRRISKRAEKIQDIERESSNISTSEYIEKLFESIKEFIDDIFPGQFEELYNKCEKNIFAMVEIVEAIVTKTSNMKR